MAAVRFAKSELVLSQPPIEIVSSKFGMHIQFHILKQIPSLNLNPEVDFCLYGRHLKKSIWCHNSAAERAITMKFGRQMENEMPMTTHTSKSKPEVEFQYGGRTFSETGSSLSKPWTEIFHRNLVWK